MRLTCLTAAFLAAALTSFAQAPSYVPTDGLMAWYPFDGNADDASGNAHHGMVSGAVLTTDRNGTADAAYSFAGNCADRIDMDLPDMANNTAFSISFWAKRDGSGCLNPRLWEFWNGGITTQCGWFNSWDYITFSGVPINTTLNDGEWIHFVLTEDGQDWRTYVNGQLTNTYAQAFVTNSPDFAIGRMNHPAYDSFNGDLDDFGVWNRTLTAQEVEAMFLSEPVNRIGGTLQTDGTDDYVSFSLPSGWGESSFTVHFSATIEDFGTTSEVDGEHYLFGHALTGQNGDIGFKAQTIPNAQQMRWAFSDDDGDGSLNIIANPVLEANTWYDFTLVFDRTTSQANVYINGAEAGSAAIPSNLGNLESGLPVGLGAFVYPPSSDFRHFHQGQFGDAYFFPAALTASQVEDLALTCSAPLVAGSAHWGVQEDEYVNLATLEPVTRVGGVVSQSAAPCQTSCTNPNIAEPTCSILPDYVPSDDLVAFFALDGNADDLGPNDFQASTASNSFITDREGNAGLAGDFDGIDDFIEIPSDAILDTIVHELTLAAWVNYTGTDHGAVLVRRDFVGNPQGERHHFQLNVDSDRALSFSAYDNSDLANHNSQTTTPPGVIQAGQWHHIALTYNEGLCTFYVDGSSVFSEDFPGQTLSPNGHWFNIGRVHRAGGNPYFDEFQGGIDEAGIWARALTEAELLALATSDANSSIQGCTDEAACNYDLEATADDGNCTYSPTIYVDGTYVSDTVFTQLNETLVFGSGAPAETDSTLLDEFSVFFNAFSAHSLPVLESGTDYRLIATGRYGFADGWSHNDAAFNYAWDVATGTKVNCNGTQDAQEDVRWLYDGATDFQRPDNDTDNNAQFCSGVDKTYFWTIPGDGNSHTVGFIDNGGYGDNSGELSFKLYELINASSITWPDGSSGPAWTYEANATGTFDLTLSDGSCSTHLVIVVDPCLADTEAPSGAANDMLVYLDGDGLAEVDSAGITIFHDDFESYPLNKTVFNYSDLWEAEPGASFDAKISNWANHTPGGNRSLRLKANGVRVALGNLSTYGSPVNLEYYCTFGSPGGVNGQNSASEITFLDGNGDDLFQYTLDGNEPTEYLDGSWSIEEIQPHQALGQTWQKVNVVFDFDADSATVFVEDIAIAGASGTDASLVSQIRIETSGGGWSFFDDFYVKSGMPVSAEDNCGIETIDVLPHLFDCDDLGDAPVSYLITDLSGNTTTVSGTITVEDHIFPSTLAIADTTLILDVNGLASLMAAEVDSSSSDNCGLASLTLSQSQFSCADVDASPLPVVLTGSDASGNSTTDTVLVTLLTNIAVDEVTVLSTPTDLQSANGEIGVSLTQGTAASFALEGLNGSPDYTFVMPSLLNGIAPGYYNVTATDPNGCVSPALPAFVPYELCCACGVHDADSDGICDDEDACTDKTSPNYNDPANLPCE